MGGMLGVLVCLYCRSGCQASVVASALAYEVFIISALFCLLLSSLSLRFHPPEPYYQFVYDEISQSYSIFFAADVPEIPYDHISVELLDTKTNTKVPVVCLRFPGANLTILFSHGNAADCGSMFMMQVVL